MYKPVEIKEAADAREISDAMLKELSGYLLESCDMEAVEITGGEASGRPVFDIGEHEISYVNGQKLLKNLPVDVRFDLEDLYPEDGGIGFASKKLIQTIKLLKSDKEYKPDPFCGMLLQWLTDPALIDSDIKAAEDLFTEDDYGLLADYGLMEGLRIFMEDEAFAAEVEEVFTSVGYQVPEGV